MVEEVLLSAGDTAWVLTSTVLVLLMSIPGIALFYGGLSKRKNVLNTMFLSFIAFAIAAIIWVTYGYQFAFGADLNGLIGSPAHILLNGILPDQLLGAGTDSVSPFPELLFVAFQLTFAALTVALVSGAVVGRMKFSAWVVFVVAWVSLIYIPICHWVWGGGWLSQLGALDFAGGTVVHINSGISALALALLLGKRKDASLIPHNLGYSAIGAGFLFFGWLGFNGGSAVAADGLASSAVLVTIIAACAASIVWNIIEVAKGEKPTFLGSISGIVAGLVGITPAAGFVDVGGAIVIGIGAAIISYFALSYLKPKLGYDDALDVFGIHGMSGIWGAIATGIFAVAAIGGTAGLIEGNVAQVGIQAIGVVATIVYAFVVTLIIGKIIDLVIGLRVDDSKEVEGLDTALHEESGYRL
ncbi:ammonium transporter [Methanobrevibacter curvatus]|uniref:Ammonium transporter n=1 Tax=Methanobrevibacter curvatus TaxID=49547 RepID=A0A166DPK6_9EURY|nr:ammonium transporter [Methanobrevibacter curvatus]KZX15824.1 ammonia channel precursor [Methanobrevibacter curvatus]